MKVFGIEEWARMASQKNISKKLSATTYFFGAILLICAQRAPGSNIGRDSGASRIKSGTGVRNDNGEAVMLTQVSIPVMPSQMPDQVRQNG